MMNALRTLRSKTFHFIVPIILLLGWEIAARFGILPQSLLPPPSRVVSVLWDWVFGTSNLAGTYSGEWLESALSSGYRVMIGYLLAVVVGLILGVAIGWFRVVEKLLEPTFEILRPTPPVSWIPVAIIWFGIADKPAIFLIFLGSLFPVMVNTVQGVKGTSKDLIRAASMMGASPWHIIRYVVLPAALPSMFSGFRIAMGTAWALSVTAEMIAVKSGLGYVLWDSYYFLRFDLVFAGMVSIGILGFLMDYLLRKIMKGLLHWQINSSAQGM